MQISTIRKKRLVIGLGKSGIAACQLLKAKGQPVVGCDKERKDIGVPCLLEEEIHSLDEFDQIVVSPGISPHHKLYAKARNENKELISEVELAFSFREKQRFIGITGTNGKTTTTLMVNHVLNRAKIPAVAAGNVGYPLSEALLAHPEALIVLELSSYQLELTNSRVLEAGVIINITPDHLDRYASFEEYKATKLRIKDLVIPGGLFLHRQSASTQENEELVYEICRHLKISNETIEKALASFQRPPHRLQHVREIEGITFINDSKATNVESTLNAIASVKGPIYLIAGGLDKQSDYTLWIEPFKEKVQALYLIGQAAPLIEKALNRDYPLYFCEQMQRAISLAYTHAKEKKERATILLSPGCASFDQFKNFEDRGCQFIEFVKETY